MHSRILKYIGVIVMLFGAASCGTLEEQRHWNVGEAHAIVKNANMYGAQYQVQLRNYENDEINLQNKIIRHQLLTETMVEYCDDGYEIIREEIVPEGLLLQNKRRENYYIYLNCL